MRRWWILAGASVALLAFAFQCSSTPCADCADGSPGADGGGDAPGPPPPPACTCPTPDAALLSPSTCCAGGSCVALHYDGLSASFADCYGVGSFVTPLALDACHAHFDAAAPCSATTCGLSQVVEGAGPAQCITWAYQGSDTTVIGHVNVSPEAGACHCPSATDPSWY